MNKPHTSSAIDKSSQIRYAIAILIGYGVGGFCLSGYQTNLFVWMVIHLLIAYIAITGRGGIVLSGACFSSMLIVYALAKPWLLIDVTHLPLKPAQFWALSLLVLWAMGILLIDLLGSAVQEFSYEQRPQWQCALFLGSLSGVALEIGHRIFVAII